MELRLSRQEIRRQMRAALGQFQAEAAGQNQEQFNVFINMAVLEMHGDGSWPSAEGRITVDLGAEQYKIAYPANCDVGGIREIAMCDDDNGESDYIPLEEAPLPAWLDVDQKEAAGGATFDSVQGNPAYWNQRGGYIYLWPVNDDTLRKLRLRYQKRVTFALDADISVVDGMCILYKALACYFASIEDQFNLDRWEKMYAKRTATLRGWQNSGRAMNLDDSATSDELRDPFRPVPNYDTRPRV